jgi:tetratricopeptide (TPR) repeat protein
MNTNPHSGHRSLVEKTFAFVSVALVAMLVAGCASVNRLREAQDSFNQAAAAENAARFDANPSDTAASLASVRSGYASALLSLGKLEPKDQQSLQQDGLWSTALTLKALCQWRLGQYDQALTAANEALNTSTNQVYPRDAALLGALPGLIKTDQGYSKILTNAPFADIQALLTGDNGAVANLQSARALVDKDHPVQIYLIQAQLAAYRNFQVAQDRLNNHVPLDPGHPARTNAVAQLKELDRLLKVHKPGASGQELVTYWQKLCGLPPPPPL